MDDLEDWLTTTQKKTMLSGASVKQETKPLLTREEKGGVGAGAKFRDVGSYDTFQKVYSEAIDSPPLKSIQDVSSEELYAKECGLDTPTKSIDMTGSWALTVNNIIGPAMMSLPHLFQNAGILPTTMVILFCSGSSSLCATFLADAISSIPGNSNFDQNIEFGTAFRRIIGEDAYYVAEILFLISCMVQACAGLVEAAQGLDGFFASFVLGRTYALQLLPNLEVISWGMEDCEIDDGGSDCTPFSQAGTMIISLGYVVCVAMFFPLSRGYLQEIIWVQLLVVVVSLILLVQFELEFYNRGLNVDIPLVGSDFGRLAGVILFNFAFSITVPTWLKEKESDVDVNAVVWSSTTVSAVAYIAFGWTAAMAFPNVDTEVLKDLASPQTHLLTRVAAAVFGVSIIGCGVPVFCVMIKSALYSSRLTNAEWSFFWGAVFPYLASFTLYQGAALMDILNWTGLVVNGSVAFILPLTLALFTMVAQRRKLESDKVVRLAQRDMQVESSGARGSAGHMMKSLSQEVAGEELRRLGLDPEADVGYQSSPNFHGVQGGTVRSSSTGGSTVPAPSASETGTSSLVDEEFAVDGSIQPLPRWLVPHREAVLVCLLAAFTVIIVSTIILDISTGVIDS